MNIKLKVQNLHVSDYKFEEKEEYCIIVSKSGQNMYLTIQRNTVVITAFVLNVADQIKFPEFHMLLLGKAWNYP